MLGCRAPCSDPGCEGGRNLLACRDAISPQGHRSEKLAARSYLGMKSQWGWGERAHLHTHPQPDYPQQPIWKANSAGGLQQHAGCVATTVESSGTATPHIVTVASPPSPPPSPASLDATGQGRFWSLQAAGEGLSCGPSSDIVGAGADPLFLARSSVSSGLC